MATIAAARSIFRSTSARSAAAKFASGTKSARSAFRAPVNNSVSQRFFRCPAELSACLETMQPFHTATSSALMTSMLSISPRCYGWVPDGFGRYCRPSAKVWEGVLHVVMWYLTLIREPLECPFLTLDRPLAMMTCENAQKIQQEF